MACLMLCGPGIMQPGCSSSTGFLGLQDYQRDLLLLVGQVAIGLLMDRAGIGDDPPQQGQPGADGRNCWDLNSNGLADEAEDRNNDNSIDALDCQGATGLSCWDLNGNGIADSAEDMNGDGFFDARDCRGTGSEPTGLACWDTDGDGHASPDEDRNGDGFFDALDCQGPEGPRGPKGDDGEAGLHCWDFNGNGVADPQEDLNQDGFFTATDCRRDAEPGDLKCWDLNLNSFAEPDEDLNGDGIVSIADCRGSDGEDGQDGEDGEDGEPGEDGADGLNCWDLNHNGSADPNEDVNDDGFFTALDCRGPAGPTGEDGQDGTNGIPCWDLNANGTADPAEDANGDMQVNVFDCRGTDGEDGEDGVDGVHCWDLNGNGIGEESEDVDNDGFYTVLDCRGPKGDDGEDGEDGADGRHCWDLNGNGIGDLAEDIDVDGFFTALDCRGPSGADGEDGEDGLTCWDLNGNRIGDPSEDTDGDGFFTVMDCRGPAGPAGSDGEDGDDGLHCWDLNGNGVGDLLEDVNNDGLFTVLDCRGRDGEDGQDGADGLQCWDLNGNGIGNVNEDINNDGFYTAADCRGQDGSDGQDGTNGLNCWDLNGNGIGDPAEDLNDDSFYTAADCRGPSGADGEDGFNCWDLNRNGVADPAEDANQDSMVDLLDCRGEDGEDGQDGRNCWDLNGNGIADPIEDIDHDGFYTAMDCRGQDGEDGSNGINCWDLNGNRANDVNEDINGDGQFNALDCAGSDGANGQNGINCWDLNGNGAADLAEDTNSDGTVDVFDCRGTGVDGDGSMFDIFNDEFFTVGAGAYDTVPLAGAIVPELISEPAFGKLAKTVAYRVSVPYLFNDVGPIAQNEIVMRVFFWREGPMEPCFLARLDAFRTRHGQGISQYGGTRYVLLNEPPAPNPAGTTVMIDLPLNNTTGGFDRGLELPDDLSAGDFLAFEWNVLPNSNADPNVAYTFLGVEFYETRPGVGQLRNADVFDSVEDAPCGIIPCMSDAECQDSDFCNGTETCNAGVCISSPRPCTVGQMCDEVVDSCVACDATVPVGRTVICHNAGNGTSHTIVVLNSEVNQHLAHGDATGACTSDCQQCNNLVVLTDVEQGAICAQQLRPEVYNSNALAGFVLSARTDVDSNSPTVPDAFGMPGRVVTSNVGAGVQNDACQGLVNISGAGDEADEELIITFDSPVMADDIIVRLNQVHFTFDEPVIFISDAQSSTTYIMLETQIQAAFTVTGFQQGLVNFANFATLPANLLVDEVKVRETQSHISVDLIQAITYGCEP